MEYCDNGELFEYIVKKIIMDYDIYRLEKLYTLFLNKTKVISFHGVADTLVSINDKLAFLANINNSSVEIIGQRRVNDIFRSCNHGLDADFLKMFEYVLRNYNTKMDRSVLFFEDKFIETNNCSYKIDNSDGIPIMYCSPKYEYPFDILSKIKL